MFYPWLFWVEIKEKMFQAQNRCEGDWNGGDFHNGIKIRRKTWARE